MAVWSKVASVAGIKKNLPDTLAVSLNGCLLSHTLLLAGVAPAQWHTDVVAGVWQRVGHVASPFPASFGSH